MSLEFSIILAVTREMGIGLENHMPWKARMPNENAYFHRLSKKAPPGLTNAVIMGRKSWDALRNPPLDDRVNIVVTRSPAVTKQQAQERGLQQIENVAFVRSLEDAVEYLLYIPNLYKTFVIGGGDLCRTAIAHPSTVRFLMTMIDINQPCDAFFPVIFDEAGHVGWRRCSVAEHAQWAGEDIPQGKVMENGAKYEFMMFEKNR